MNDEVAEKVDNKNVKFSDARINDLFSLLNEKIQPQSIISPLTDRTQMLSNGRYISKKQYMEELKRRGEIASADVNAYLTFPAGNSYDGMADEERNEMCKKEADKTIAAINSTLAASSGDPLFSKLHAQMKNTHIHFSYDRKDISDDGYDTYCCQIWLKISYSG